MWRHEVNNQVMSWVKDLHPGLWNFICSKSTEEFSQYSYSHIRDGKVRFYEMYVSGKNELNGTYTVKMKEVRRGEKGIKPVIQYDLSHLAVKSTTVPRHPSLV